MMSLINYVNEKFMEIHTDDLSQVLKDIIYSENFIQDNKDIFSKCTTDLECRLELINNDNSIEVCIYVSEYYQDVVKGITYYMLQSSDHYDFIMKYKNKYYDAYNYTGVNKLSQLKFVELYMKNYDDHSIVANLHLLSRNEFDYIKANQIIKNKNLTNHEKS